MTTALAPSSAADRGGPLRPVRRPGLPPRGAPVRRRAPVLRPPRPRARREAQADRRHRGRRDRQAGRHQATSARRRALTTRRTTLQTAPDPTVRGRLLCERVAACPARGPGRPGDRGRPGRHPGADPAGLDPGARRDPGLGLGGRQRDGVGGVRRRRRGAGRGRGRQVPRPGPTAQGRRDPGLDPVDRRRPRHRRASSSSRWSGCSSGSCSASTSPSTRRVGGAAAWPSTKHALKAVGLSILIELAAGLLATFIWVAGVVLT